MVSKHSKYPVYIYDLPSVTQSQITREILDPLMKMHNIAGIKTANINLILDLFRNNPVRDSFSIFYSGLDSFDAAIKLGVKRNLDGMFTCTPYNSKMMYKNMEDGDEVKTSYHLNNILSLRNTFLKGDILPAYSYAMELIGCTGNYYPDYDKPISGKLKEEIFECMKLIKEINDFSCTKFEIKRSRSYNAINASTFQSFNSIKYSIDRAVHYSNHYRDPFGYCINA